MQVTIAGQVGEERAASGAYPDVRLGNSAEQIVQPLHGWYYEQCARQHLFSYGVSNTALVAANAIATGVTSTAQPVLGLWNPPTSGFDLVVLKAALVLTTVANSAVSPGGFMWLGAIGQVLTTGTAPFNMRTLSQSGSVAKAFSISTALTGLVGSLSTMRASSIACHNAAGAATAATLTVSPTEEIVDGAIIVPPGGVLALMNQVSTTTVSYSTYIMWEEVLIPA